MKINHRCHQLRTGSTYNGSLLVESASPAELHNDNANDMETRSNLDRARKQSSARVAALGGRDVDHVYLFTR